MNNIFRKLSLSKWNIGFAECTPECAVHDPKGLTSRIKWLEHGFDDRFFADPFILDVIDGRLHVLAEERAYDNNKGRIVLLEIDIRTGKLKDACEVLKNGSHLSYPFIIRHENHIFIVPESGSKGSLDLYRYDPASRKACFIMTLLPHPLIDATLFSHGGYWWLMAGDLRRKCNSNLWIYRSRGLTGEYTLIDGNPFIRDESSARPAGGIFRIGGDLFRPSQNSRKGYGSSVKLNRICELSENGYREEPVAELTPPPDHHYRNGIHTLNFHKGFCVVDGNRLAFAPARKIKAFFNNE